VWSESTFEEAVGFGVQEGVRDNFPTCAPGKVGLDNGAVSCSILTSSVCQSQLAAGGLDRKSSVRDSGPHDFLLELRSPCLAVRA